MDEDQEAAGRAAIEANGRLALDELGPLVMSKIQGVPGITRTVTCTVVHA